MTENNNNPADTEIKKITPARVELTGHTTAQPEKKQGRKSTARDLAITVFFFVLILGAVLVIFVLPFFVDEDQTPAVAEKPAAGSNTQPRPATTITPAAPADSPWKKAQLSELRKETQNILAEMLEAGKTLTEKNVTIWAGEDYSRALQLAESGDNHYGAQDFEAARDDYAKALEILQRLLQQVDVVFEEKMESGTRALLEGDSATARAAFDVALVIDPIDRMAVAGRERADKLDDVIALVKRGDEAMQNSSLDEAKSFYQQALDLDAETISAREKLDQVRTRINEREFGRWMSAGFEHLQADRLEQARDSFSMAMKIYPDSRDARTALVQANHSITSRDINNLLARARQDEANEQWTDAAKRYEQALKLDANLVTAQQGLKRAQTWSAIHARIDQILAQPQRLYDIDVLNETSLFLASIDKVSNPGKKFNSKLKSLNTAVAKADNPVLIQLQSDNMTRVTLYKYKNGDLGYFTTRELVLRPGKYVATGQREGYRDVRVEFFVDPDKPQQPVVIKTRDKIALGK